MKIVRVSHGLANQMFQYTLYKYLSLHNKDKCYLDDSYFMSPDVPHNGLEIDKIFDIKPLWLRDCFSPQAWEHISHEMRSNRIHYYAESLGITASVITDEYARHYSIPRQELKYRELKDIYSIPYFETGACRYNIHSLGFAGHCYYAGSWVSDIFFNAISDVMLKEFTFPLFDERNKKMADDLSGCTSVGVHVRRFVLDASGTAFQAERYHRPVGIIKRTVKNPVFFIFSDDLEWCKENVYKMSFTSQDELVFVSGNTGTRSFRDMQLMTYCKHLIRAPLSSFSYMADILNRNPYRKTISRKYFY